MRYHDGYLAQEDLGLIGDGATAALVGLDGSILWLCLPRFDGEALLCGLLDRRRGGRFSVAPSDGVVEARQRYDPDTAVLVTELLSPTGLVRLTDALVVRPGDFSDQQEAGTSEHVRSAVVLDGHVDLRVGSNHDTRLVSRPLVVGSRLSLTIVCISGCTCGRASRSRVWRASSRLAPANSSISCCTGVRRAVTVIAATRHLPCSTGRPARGATGCAALRTPDQRS